MNDIIYNRRIVSTLIIFIVFLSSCKSGLFNVFVPDSPYEAYKTNLISSGLGQTAMGKTWIEMSDKILATPVEIEIPYLEKGYFSPDRIQVAAFIFRMERGQRLNVKLNKKPIHRFMIFADIWERDEANTLNFLGSLDTLGTAFQFDINKTSTYLLRLQPELLAGGEYTLEITSGPSLDYPLKSYHRTQIRSFWGDKRDGDSRKHEGVDIFSTYRTPVLAIVPGTTRVNDNNLGGKVVWLRPEGKEFTIYYAHLDEQTVSDGQSVEIGDTIGRMGNTGNAKSTPPHLHFGIYTRDGAVDPLPFINPVDKNAPDIRSQIALLSSTLRTVKDASLIGGQSDTILRNGTIVRVLSATADNFRVVMPDGTTGFLTSGKVVETSGILRKLKLNSSQALIFDRPDTTAAVKLRLQPGDTVNLIGNFRDYDYISTGTDTGWMKH